MMPTQRPLYLYIGWLLIGVGAALVIPPLLHVRWADPLSILSLIPAAMLIAGVFVFAGIITLKQKWGDPAANISGLICFFVFLALNPVSSRFSRDLSQSPEHGFIHSVLGLLINLAPLFIALWLHKNLTPKIRTILARRTVRH
ncbi:MAG: hypothetical protein H7343_22105 [Undibacterium sp.]|nr:hypothetical protein [Opitutaceae bacterium]